MNTLEEEHRVWLAQRARARTHSEAPPRAAVADPPYRADQGAGPEVAEQLRLAAAACDRLGLTRQRVYDALPVEDNRGLSLTQIASIVGVDMQNVAERAALRHTLTAARGVRTFIKDTRQGDLTLYARHGAPKTPRTPSPAGPPAPRSPTP